MGELLHLVVGGFFGLSTIFLLKKTGKDHYKFKGLAIRMFVWGARVPITLKPLLMPSLV